jgi:hypothetical protein
VLAKETRAVWLSPHVNAEGEPSEDTARLDKTLPNTSKHYKYSKNKSSFKLLSSAKNS